jgi:hypothetical protein
MNKSLDFKELRVNITHLHFIGLLHSYVITAGQTDNATGQATPTCKRY